MIDFMRTYFDAEVVLPGAVRAVPFGASSEPMGIVFVVAMALLAIALVLAALARWVRYRNTPSPQLRRECLRYLPLPDEVQRAVREQLRNGDRAEALATLRTWCGNAISPWDAEELAGRLDDQPNPTTFAEALHALRSQEPALAEEVLRIARDESEVAAIRALRARLPLDLGTAKELVAARHETV